MRSAFFRIFRIFLHLLGRSLSVVFKRKPFSRTLRLNYRVAL